MLKTPKTIATWSGLGKLYRDQDLIAQVEYGLRVCKDQETFPTQTCEDAASTYFTAGTFTAVGYEPDIEEGSEMLLELEGGNRVSVVIVRYDFGQGSFQLTTRSVNELFPNR